ncbi:30S ribosomal protein S1, partial [bacterium E08(2017)]
PWSTIATKFSIGQVVTGKVSKVATFGAFVEIEEGIDGLVHISQISENHVENVKDALNVGSEVEARIVKIDREERRIGLSIKAMTMPEEEFVQEAEDILDGLRPGEDMVGLASAFDEALGNAGMMQEEWHPGDSSEDEKSAESSD